MVHHLRVPHGKVEEQVWPQASAAKLLKMLLLALCRLDTHVLVGQVEGVEGGERFEAIGQVDVVLAAT